MPKVKTFRKTPDLPKLEQEIQKWWEENKIFEKSVEERSKDNAFVFYDGPPFATGMPHYGHLLGSTAKDVIPRFQTMLGKRVERVWGWDCHGLPIENMIEKKLDIQGGKQGIEDMGIDKFNQACRAEVLRLDEEWEKIIGRLGRWVDFEHNYKTMDKSYMESVWWGFKQLYEKGLVYQGRRVILYCPRCSTPLSNFEIAMDHSYKDTNDIANVYKYPLKDQENTYLLAWSTTPWNKLATPALAVNPNFTYAKVKQGEEYYVLAKSRLEMLKDDSDYKVVAEYQGQELDGWQFELHYDFYPDCNQDERAGVVVVDDFVTDDTGTGVVTLAAYGEEDYQVMKDNNIQIVIHVDDEGKLKEEVKPWAGMDILQANSKINADLKERGLVYDGHQHFHSVPVCYRCGTRLYYSPVPAWFIDVQAIKDELINQNEEINWVPDHLKHGRFLKGLKNAPDWNVSRTRYWGTPMPIWQGEKDGKQYRRIIGSIKELKQWAVNPEEIKSEMDLHREQIDPIKVYVDDDKTVVGERIAEVFDCWVESGSMPFASVHYPFENEEFFNENYPAQYVSEYVAQTRAWFYTMHVMSVGIFGKPAFENVLTTGTILAKDEAKMSKSKKNFPDPMKVINEYGVDSLRLYLMSSTVMKAENLSFDKKEVSDLRKKVFLIWWNMISFFKLFAQQDIDPQQLPESADHILDRWLLSKFNSLTKEVTHHLKEYDIVRASRELIAFVNLLSTWYLRLSRDRLRATDNQLVSHVFGGVLYHLAQLYAPITPFFSELVHHNLVDENSSIHLTDWPEVQEKLVDEQLETEMETIEQIVETGRGLRRDKQIKLRHPLASLQVSLKKNLKYRDELEQLLLNELNVKQVVWQENSDQLEVDYDYELTPALKEEAQARDLIREIQNLRRKAKLKLDDQVVVQLPDWPQDWTEEIQKRTNSTLEKGDTMKLVE